MRRRDFMAGLGGAAAMPLAVHAQQPAMPMVAFVRDTSLAPFTHLVTAFRQGLKEAGFVEGQNVTVELRSTDGQPDRLPVVVADLLRQRVAVIVGNLNSALAAKAATTTVPIISVTGGDPVALGLVASLNRPGGNVTGMHFFFSALGPKRLDLLRQSVPRATTIGMLVNPGNPNTEAERRDIQRAAQSIGQQLVILDVRSDRDIETAFATLVQRGVGALLVGSGGFMNSHREHVAALAARHRLPASYVWRETVKAGGFMSYGPSQSDAHRQAGIYAGRILNGEKPADLPVIQSTRFEFVINLKTAKTLGLELPQGLILAADEVRIIPPCSWHLADMAARPPDVRFRE